METAENAAAAAVHKSTEGRLMAVKTETQDTPSKLPMTVTLVSSSPGDQSSKRENPERDAFTQTVMLIRSILTGS